MRQACSTVAAVNGFTGTWYPLISSTTWDASSVTGTNTTRNIYNLNKELVATSESALWDAANSSLLASVNYQPNGTSPGTQVYEFMWTFSTAAGAKKSVATGAPSSSGYNACEDWTFQSSIDSADIGYSSVTDSGWMDYSSYACDTNQPFYCVGNYALPTDTPTAGPTSTSTDTPADTPTDTPTETPTDTPIDTATDTPTEIPTGAPTDTPTEIPTGAPTDTATDTPTEIPTGAPTDTATDTPTEIPTRAPTDTATETPTETPTNTPADTPTVTPTNTPTAPPPSVSPGQNLAPPAVVVQGQTITVSMSRFQPVLKGKALQNAITILMRKGLSRKRALQAVKFLVIKYKVTVKYIKRRSSTAEAGVFEDEIDILGSRGGQYTSRNNQLSVRNLSPGNYSASYSVTISTRNPAVDVGSSNTSRPRNFSIR
jgi:hypothetical protein